MRLIRTAVALVAMALVAGCGDDRGTTTARARPPDEAQLAGEGRLTLGDSQVVAVLQVPQVPGRLVYDPPVDLSLASARRTRPDLVRGDTTRRDTSRAATRRDTTGGDATVDTSGGAPRPKRP